MNEMSKSNGNSKIVVCTLIAILVSIAVSSLIASFVLKGTQGVQGLKGDTGIQGIQGLKGDKGDTGEQGIKGNQGIQGNQGVQGETGTEGSKGDAGGIVEYVSAGLVDHFASVWLGTDHHTVQGYIINFGSTNASNVKISMTWSMGAGSYVYKTYNCFTITGYQVKYIDVTYDFEGQGVLSYTVEWS